MISRYLFVKGDISAPNPIRKVGITGSADDLLQGHFPRGGELYGVFGSWHTLLLQSGTLGARNPLRVTRMVAVL